MKYTVTPIITGPHSFAIEIKTDPEVEGLAAQVTREICNLKDQAVRKALINRGWTPPPEECAVPEKPAP